MKKVLLLGDSIRMGYDDYVKEELDGKCEVIYDAEDNGRFAAYTLWQANQMFKHHGHFDVVHWNNGYCTFGDILSNLIWCGMMIWLSYCAIRGLAYAETRTGAARNMRYFHIGVLCFAFAEYLLWTAGCFWPDTSLASPVFWCDMLLTLTILGLLPAVRKAVDA